MAFEWKLMLVVWAIVEGIEFFRKKPSRARMKTGAYWGVAVMTLYMYDSVSAQQSNFIPTLLLLLATSSAGAFIIYWMRVAIAQLAIIILKRFEKKRR